MPASIFAGSKVKTLKSTLSLNGGADIISSTTNPQTSAISAEPGSLLLNTTSGIMYRKLDAGSTTNWVEVGAGSGGKNYIKNPDFDGGATTSWSMQKVSLSSLVPTGNIGAPDAGHTIATSSSSPLEGANSLLVQGASAFTAGNCLVSEAFAIDREDMAKVMGWSFYYEAVTSNMDFSGTSAGTWAVYIAEVTTATPDTVLSWIQPAGVYNLVQSSGAGIASGTFQTTATGTAYRLVLVCINSEAAATTLKVDDFQLGPQKVLQGPSGPVGEIIATGSVTPPAGFLYCNGQSVSVSQYQDLFNSIGYTYGGSGANFNVPDLRGVFLRGAGSQTIGAETYSATLGQKQNDATAKNGLFDSGHVHTQQAPNLATGGAINVRQYVSGTGSVPTSENITTASGAANLSSTDTETRPANVAVAYHIRYLATYQMSQDTDTRVVAALYNGTPTGTLSGSNNDVTFPTKISDTHSFVSGSSVTIPVSGFYSISASALINGTYSVGNYALLAIAIDTVEKYRNVQVAGGAVSALYPAVVVNSIYLNAGQVVKIQSNTNATSPSFGSSTANQFSINRLSGPATIAASETVAMSAYKISGNHTANGSEQAVSAWTDLVYDTHGSFNMTTGIYTVPVSGRYLITGRVRFNSSAPTITSSVNNSLGGDVSVGGYGAPFAVILKFNAGQTIQIFSFQNGAASLPYAIDSRYSTALNIVRVGN